MACYGKMNMFHSHESRALVWTFVAAAAEVVVFARIVAPFQKSTTSASTASTRCSIGRGGMEVDVEEEVGDDLLLQK